MHSWWLNWLHLEQRIIHDLKIHVDLVGEGA